MAWEIHFYKSLIMLRKAVVKILWLALLFSPTVVCAQGIHFENGLSWEQIKEKAKAENKYIFVDCYASWCGPCKKMDQEVYTEDSVGTVVNEKFISVKVQIDTSKNDNDAIKAWYADAHALMASYVVTAFPTFLFFSPSGELVHRGLGYQQPKNFAQLTVEALDPHKEYYVLVARYQKGARDYAIMPDLANRAKSFNDNALADSIAADYLHGYLDKLDFTEICTRSNLGFIAIFAKVLSSKDEVFKCIYGHPKLVDTTMHDRNLAERFVNYIVIKEEIIPATEEAKKKGKEPDWGMIGKHIEQHYGVTWVEKNVLNAKIGWYKVQQEWPDYTRCLVQRMDIVVLKDTPHDFGSLMGVNGSAWEVFLYSNRKDELDKALIWSDWVVQEEQSPNGGFMDTKANLLYKLGRKEEALALETKAVQADPGNKEITDNFEKMRRSEPTWTVAH